MSGVLSDPEPGSLPGLSDDVFRAVLAAPQTAPGARTQLHHLGFEVSDIGAAIRHWSSVFNIGPFLAMVDRSGPGEPVRRPAFGWWGSIYIELLPPQSPEFRESAQLRGRLDHVCYITAAPADESARLDGLDLPKLREMRHGQLWSQQHGAGPTLGCSIEIHQPSQDLAGLFLAVREAAEAWDGTEVERVIDEPGTTPHA